MLVNKVKIEFSIYQLSRVNQELECLDYGMDNPTRQVRVTRSILQNVVKKLKKKQIDKAHSKTKFNISFEYYEAYSLEQVLLILNNIDYSHSLQQTINAINQKTS